MGVPTRAARRRMCPPFARPPGARKGTRLTGAATCYCGHQNGGAGGRVSQAGG
jgi:hypothetical protein